MNSKQLGILGEKIALNFLEKKGYQLLDKNYSIKYQGGPKRGEIDIITKKNGTISFVEVKTLRQARGEAFLPEEKVDYFKQKKIIKTANSWLMKNRIPLDNKWQIDVVALKIDLDTKKAKIRHFKNAIIY